MPSENAFGAVCGDDDLDGTFEDDVEVVRRVALSVQVLTGGHRLSFADWRQRREFRDVQLEEGFCVRCQGYPPASP